MMVKLLFNFRTFIPTHIALLRNYEAVNYFTVVLFYKQQSFKRSTFSNFVSNSLQEKKDLQFITSLLAYN